MSDCFTDEEALELEMELRAIRAEFLGLTNQLAGYWIYRSYDENYMKMIFEGVVRRRKTLEKFLEEYVRDNYGQA